MIWSPDFFHDLHIFYGLAQSLSNPSPCPAYFGLAISFLSLPKSNPFLSSRILYGCARQISRKPASPII